MTSNAKENSKNVLIQYITKNQNKLYQLAYSYVRDEQLALDLIQDSIVKALTKISTLKKEEYVKTWFYRILINECLTNIRKGKCKEFLNLEDYDFPYEDSDGLEASEIYQAVDKLKPKLKTVVILRFFEDMKLEEIVKITGVNLSTVKSRLYKALKELKITMVEKEVQ